MPSSKRHVTSVAPDNHAGGGDSFSKPPLIKRAKGLNPSSRGKDVAFFDSAVHFRSWLEENHDKSTEQWIGFVKKTKSSTKKPAGSFTYRQAVDEALAYGWVDGLLNRIDEESYALRFTPRKSKSNWSVVNIRRVEELEAAGRMAAPGLQAFETRDKSRSEEQVATLSDEYEAEFRRDKAAWAFYSEQPPGYRRRSAWHIMSAKKDETRRARLLRLIDASGRRERL